MRLLAAFIGRLRKFKQGKFLWGFCRLTPNKVFHEDIAGACGQPDTCHVHLLLCCSVLFLFDFFRSYPHQCSCWRRQRCRCEGYLGFSCDLYHQAVQMGMCSFTNTRVNSPQQCFSGFWLIYFFSFSLYFVLIQQWVGGESIQRLWSYICFGFVYLWIVL